MPAYKTIFSPAEMFIPKEKDADKCKKHTHSTAKQAAQIANLAGAGKLVIGHFSAREDDHTVFLNEAQEVFANTILAEECKSIEL